LRALSPLALIPTADRERGFKQLHADLESSEWRRLWGHLLELDGLDLGFRVVVAELGKTGSNAHA